MTTIPAPVLKLTGEVDVHAARRLSEPLSSLLGSSAPAIIVDASGVTFMDSTGLGALMRVHERLDRQGRALILVCPPGPVRRLLELTGLMDALRVVPDEPSAQAAALADRSTLGERPATAAPSP
jgi:anti-sigma B factor antagonist